MQKKINNIISNIILSTEQSLEHYLDTLLIDNNEVFITFKINKNEIHLETIFQEINANKNTISKLINQLLPEHKIYINCIKLETKPTFTKTKFSNIKNIIGIASGKGGVGKSTVSVYLAYAFNSMGLKVGILDGDIYGPSINFMMGEGKEYIENSDPLNKAIPLLEKDGIKYNSVSTFLNNQDDPILLKSPMVLKLFNQIISTSPWGNLDILLIDLPPGTGDLHLNLSLKFELLGIVMVCTPQKLALLDATKAINMYKKTNVALLGAVENMSSFVCPKCGEISHIFDSNGVEDMSTKLNIDFLGRIPINLKIRELSDNHNNLIKEDIHNTDSKYFIDIAQKILLKTN